jgi:pilus assembly protein CpaB
MKRRTLIIAAVCGILAALCTGIYLNSLESSYRRGAQRMKVLAAKQYIDQGTVIDETMVVEQSVPKEFIQPKALLSLKDLASPDGKKMFMTLVPVEKGEQLVTTKLVILGLESGIAALIPNDKRAVTLVLDREKVTGLIKPGNRVDILGVFDYEDRERRTQEAAATVLQNVLVLAVGNSYLGAPAPEASRAAKGELPAPADDRVPVSLALSPQEAELFVLAAEKGSINFSLRPTGDAQLVALAPSRMQDIFRDVSVVINDRDAAAGSATAMQKSRREALEILKKYQKN